MNTAVPKNLRPVFEAIVGYTITIDLRNEVSITGTIDIVDKWMNFILVNATVSTRLQLANEADETPRQLPVFEQLYVNSRNIRFVHLPAKLDLRLVLNQKAKFDKHQRKAGKFSMPGPK